MIFPFESGAKKIVPRIIQGDPFTSDAMYAGSVKSIGFAFTYQEGRHMKVEGNPSIEVARQQAEPQVKPKTLEKKTEGSDQEEVRESSSEKSQESAKAAVGVGQRVNVEA